MSLLGDGTLRLQGRERDRQSWQASPVDVGMQRRFRELLRGVSCLLVAPVGQILPASHAGPGSRPPQVGGHGMNRNVLAELTMAGIEMSWLVTIDRS